MTDRITQKATPMKEYGRKPYLVTKETVPIGEQADYRYMMDTTWTKAQDNEYMVVQSVKKKPYQQQDYQMMENEGNLITGYNIKFEYPFSFPKPNPQPPDDTSQQTIIGGIKWIQCPTSVSASKTYTIIVQNSSITTRTLVGGRLNGTQTTYFPTSFQLVKDTSDAKGLSISNLIDKGSTTWITLTTSSSVTGSYYLKATDGKNTIEKKIAGVSGNYFGLSLYIPGNYYYAIYDQYLNYMGVYPDTNVTVVTPVIEDKFIWYNDTVVNTYTTSIKKSGSYYKGPYSLDYETNLGESITCDVPKYTDGVYSNTGCGASLGDYCLFGYTYTIEGDSYDSYSYLNINDVETEIGHFDLAESEGFTCIMHTFKYDEFLSNVIVPGSGYTYDFDTLVIRIMDVGGTVVTKDLSDIYSYAGKNCATYEGTTYQLNPYFKKVNIK